jgi:hypothetical protein
VAAFVSGLGAAEADECDDGERDGRVAVAEALGLVGAGVPASWMTESYNTRPATGSSSTLPVSPVPGGE